MSYSPVAMFVYNRADHFQKTFEALSKCKEAKDSDLFIFSDGAKNEKALDGVNAVRSAIHEIENTQLFRSVTIVEAPENRGLAASIISGVTEVIKRYGKIIVIEDDCVASPYLLKYMNNCLDTFEKDARVGAIAGFSPALTLPRDYTADTFTAYRSCSCTWASWADRWEGVDWNFADKKSFFKPDFVKKLNSNGADRFIRLYRQTKGNGSSWSVRFGAHLVKNDLLTVYPRYSYISNIGCDASGVHSQTEDAEAMSVDLSKAIPEPKIAFEPLNPEIQKTMKKHYSGGLLSDIKRSTATTLIVIKENLK